MSLRNANMPLPSEHGLRSRECRSLMFRGSGVCAFVGLGACPCSTNLNVHELADDMPAALSRHLAKLVDLHLGVLIAGGGHPGVQRNTGCVRLGTVLGHDCNTRERLQTWGLLNGLAHRFGDARLKGDLSVSDARRLAPAFGSVKRKGEDTADRSHRRSFFVCQPDAVGLTLEQLRQLHAAFAVPGAARRGSGKRDHGQYVEDTGSVWYRCGQVNIRDVAGRLGIDTDSPRCPVCDGGEGGRGSASSCS